MRWVTAGWIERYAVNAGESVKVERGFVMVVTSRVLVINGYLRLDGVVKVG